MPIREVGLAKLAQVVAVRPEMVIHHIEQNGQTTVMGGVYQAAQAFWPTIDAGWSEEAYTIVAPVTVAGKIGHRHQLNRRHAQGTQVIQALDQGVKRAGGGCRTNVGFIDHQVCERQSLPAGIRPGKSGWVNHTGRAVNTVWLIA